MKPEEIAKLSTDGWHVRRGKLQLTGEQLQMAASCYHRRGRSGMSACGGCYARLHEALARVRKATTIEDAHAVVETVLSAMKEDATP